MFSRLLKRWEISTSSGNHFQVLDGLRGVAILLVVAYHTFYTNPSHGLVSALIGHAITAGWMGVPIFFVLSGFLITYPFFKGRWKNSNFVYPHGYSWRRLAKIVPPYYLSLVFCSIFYWLRFHDPEYLKAAALWAMGLEDYFLPTVPFNLSYWSLIVEVHFYCLVPLLFLLARKLNIRHTALVLVFVFYFLPLGLRCVAWHWSDVLVAHGGHLRFFVERFPLCQMDYFSWGVGFACVYTELESQREKYCKLAILGYLGLIIFALTIGFWSVACFKFDLLTETLQWSLESFRFLSGLSGFLLLFFVFNPNCYGSKCLSKASLQFIGIVSFEWFLFHGPIVSWFRESVGHTNGSILAYAWRTIVPLVVTFIFSALVYRYFSLPILNRVRDSLKPTKV